MAIFPDTPEGIIEELRRQAVDAADEIGMPDLPVSEMLESEAADLIERWQKGPVLCSKHTNPIFNGLA